MLAANPYCVWTRTGHMRTFKTLAGAQRFAAKDSNHGRVGSWSETEKWWIENPSPAKDQQP